VLADDGCDDDDDDVKVETQTRVVVVVVDDVFAVIEREESERSRLSASGEVFG